MKVALLGAPQAGKTKLAGSLKRKLGSDWMVIDGYADRLNKRVGMMGTDVTSYPHEIEMIGARWADEDVAFVKDLNSITCGSIYESIIYASSIQMWSQNEQMILEDQIYTATIMQALGALQHKTFDYDLVFYLPWPEEKQDHSWYAVVDAKIPEVLVGFNVPFIVLTGTNKQRTNEALKCIAAYQEFAAEDVQRAV